MKGFVALSLKDFDGCIHVRIERIDYIADCKDGGGALGLIDDDSYLRVKECAAECIRLIAEAERGE